MNARKMLNAVCNRRTVVASAMTAVFMLSAVLLQSHVVTGADVVTQSLSLQPMSLTIAAPNGSQIILQAVDIGALPSYEGRGGYKKKTGAIVGPDNYTGVTLNTLCDLVGGMRENEILYLTSIDGYSMSFTYGQVDGGFATYDPVTGNPVTHNDSIVPILAYFKNDANISLSEGPLRIAIVGPEGLITESQYWSKSVVKLEIRWFDDVAISGIMSERNVIENGSLCQINVVATNEGGYAETFNVTISANTTNIGVAENVALAAGDSIVLSFTWNTSNFAHGNYVLSARASVVPLELDKADNVLADGTIAVTIRGDVNGDFKVDLFDITTMSGIYGSKLGDPHFNQVCDLDNDGRITIFDLVTCAAQYGQTIP